VLIAMAEPTKGVMDAVNHGGTYYLPVNQQAFPLVQVLTIEELLQGIRPKMPLTFMPYIQAARHAPSADQGETLFAV
jgi:hypothetical protein